MLDGGAGNVSLMLTSPSLQVRFKRARTLRMSALAPLLSAMTGPPTRMQKKIGNSGWIDVQALTDDLYFFLQRVMRAIHVRPLDRFGLRGGIGRGWVLKWPPAAPSCRIPSPHFPSHHGYSHQKKERKCRFRRRPSACILSFSCSVNSTPCLGVNRQSFSCPSCYQPLRRYA